MCVCVVGGVVIKKVARKITQLLNKYQIKKDDLLKQSNNLNIKTITIDSDSDSDNSESDLPNMITKTIKPKNIVRESNSDSDNSD